MISWETLAKNERQFLALTGLTVPEAEAVVEPFRRVYREKYPLTRTMDGKRRRRKAGAGNAGKLRGAKQKLLFILIYVKTYPLEEMLGAMFEMSQSRVSQWIHRLLPVVERALERMGLLPERRGAKAAKRAGRTKNPVLIVDGTDRARQRPKDEKRQRNLYSGKKKRHTEKNLVLVEEKSLDVAYVSKTVAGKVHDKKMVDQDPIRYPPGTTLLKDTGFQGYEPNVAKSRQPKKTSRPRANGEGESEESAHRATTRARGARHRRDQTLPHRQGCPASKAGGRVGSRDGHRVRIAQPTRAISL